MSIKDHAILVSLTVNKPQMTVKDEKATRDVERANNAIDAGQFRKDLYPKALIQPISTVESSARAYMESRTYMWARGEFLLPSLRFMPFADRMAKYEVEFNQGVIAFLNNWANVMRRAQENQGALFDPSSYPDLSTLRAGFRMKVNYRPITDYGDFRVSMQEEELSALRSQVEQATTESMNTLLRSPLERLRKVVAHLHETTGKQDRTVVSKRTGQADVKAPIFRDSVVDNIIEEVAMLTELAVIMPPALMQLAEDIIEVTPSAETLRNDPVKRLLTHNESANLLTAIDSMLED
jgi:hypothetical protein